MALDAAFMRIMERLTRLEGLAERMGVREVAGPGQIVALKYQVIASNLSTTSTTRVEMSTGYRITHGMGITSNVIVLVCCATITLGAGEGCGTGFFRDGTDIGAAYGNFGVADASNRVWAARIPQGDVSSHTWSPAWNAAGAYQIDGSGGGVANGLFLLAEVVPA